MTSGGITVTRLTTPPSTVQWSSQFTGNNNNNYNAVSGNSGEDSYVDKDTDTITYDSYSPTTEFPQGSLLDSWEEDPDFSLKEETHFTESGARYTDDFESDEIKTKKVKDGSRVDTDFESETVKYSDNFETEAISKTLNTYSSDFDTEVLSKTTKTSGFDMKYSSDFESEVSTKKRTNKKSRGLGSIDASVAESSQEAGSYRSETYAETYESAVFPSRSYVSAGEYESDDEEESEQYSSDFEETEDSRLKEERQNRIARETQQALEEFTSAMISKIRQKKFDETDLTQLESVHEAVKPKSERNFQQERYIKKKLKYLKQKKLNENDKDLHKNEEMQEGSSSMTKSITDYGLNPKLIERLKVTNTLDRMKKIANTEIHDPRKCRECRKLKMKMDEEEAKRNFIREKSRHIAQKIIEDRIQRHLLHMHSVNLIGNLAKDLPSHAMDPDLVSDLMNKGLSTTRWRVVPE